MNSPTVQGTAVSPGLALGPVHVIHAEPSNVPAWTVSRSDVPIEIGRLAAALNHAAERLHERQRAVARSASEKDAEIFAVHRMILQDPNAMRDVEQLIAEQRINAEAAVQILIQRFEEKLSKLDGNSVRAYGADVSDPWRLVLDVLLQRDREEILQGDEPVVLAAAELTPKVVTYLERHRVLAIATEKGGRFSHGAVLARSFGTPCVVGLPNFLARLEQGMVLSVDGDRGVVVLRPSQAEIDEFLERRRSLESRRGVFLQECHLPARTPDGATLEVGTNIESLRDFDTFDIAQTDGVGLLRTEFLYMERNQFPSEEEQYRLYRLALERLDGRPATIRLLDIGGDKQLPYFQVPPETNPALGWRGIRITLQWRDLMRIQLRALLRASVAGDLRILLPMVTSLDEVHQIHQIFDEVRAELASQGYQTDPEIPVGSMIEVPSLLLQLEPLAEAVDFLSVGTNDLVQYLLAVDRDNSWVSHLYDPHHPAVLAALERVVAAARKAGKPASVCGDAAGDPLMAVLLLGLGYQAISVAPQFVPEIKYAVRRTRLADAHAFATELLGHKSASGVRAVMERMRKKLYECEDPSRAT